MKKMMVKTKSILRIICIILCIALFTMPVLAASMPAKQLLSDDQYDSDWHYWSQGGTRYRFYSGSGKGMHGGGCHIVAQSKLLADAFPSAVPSSFDPDVLLEWGSKDGKYFYNTNGIGVAVGEKNEGSPAAAAYAKEVLNQNLYYYGKLTISSYNNNLTEAEMLMALLNRGFYIIIGNSSHEVYISNRNENNVAQTSPVVYTSKSDAINHSKHFGYDSANKEVIWTQIVNTQLPAARKYFIEDFSPSVYTYAKFYSKSNTVTAVTTKATSITDTSAVLNGMLIAPSSKHITEHGARIRKVGETTWHTIKDANLDKDKQFLTMFYTTSKYNYALEPGTQYEYYQYVVADGTTYSGNTVTFKTTGTSAATYTVSYNANGGSGAPAAQTKTHNTALTLSSTKPSRSGYVFLGWAESSTASTPVYQPGGSYTKNESKTLYAVWGKNFEITGGKGTYTLGDTVTISYSAGGATSYDIEIRLLGEDEVFRVDGTTATSVTYTPTKAGNYNISAVVHLINGSTYQHVTLGGPHFSVVELPSNLVASTDKSTYQLGEAVTFSLSANNAAKYAISVWDGGAFSEGNRVYSSGYSETGSFTFTPTAVGTYGIGYQAENSAGKYITATGVFTVVAPVQITTQPADVTVAAGKTATFKVTATGATSYQWYYRTSSTGSWTAVAASSGKTSSYSLTAAERHNGYQYRCKVTNSVGSVYSNTVTLTVNSKPVITSQPTNVTVTAGQTATFKVTATGATSYQWYYRTSSTGSWTTVAASSGKTSTYSLTAAARHNGYQYRCLVKNASGEVDTNTVTLTVNSKPVITTQPTNKTVDAGSTASFKVTATGATSYQWYYRTSSTGSWTAVAASSGKTATYSLTAEARHNGYQYRCKVTNTVGSVYSNTVTLTVNSKPVITTQPTNVTVTAGQTATFKVTAAGATSYQWYVSKDKGATWTEILNNSTSATYALATQAKHNGYRYYCKVTNAAGSVYSNTVTLTVNSKPVITTQPTNVTVTAGQTATFKVTATGATSYQWYYRTSSSGSWTTVAASSGKTSTYSLTAETRHNGYQYYCKVTNAAGSVISNTVTLTVSGKPQITEQPTSWSVTAGSTATFKVTATGATSYQWYYRTSSTGSWTAVAAASGKTSTYKLTAAARHDGYQYRCKVSNENGDVYTVIVTLVVT